MVLGKYLTRVMYLYHCDKISLVTNQCIYNLQVQCNVFKGASGEVGLTCGGGLRQLPGLNETYENAALVLNRRSFDCKHVRIIHICVFIKLLSFRLEFTMGVFSMSLFLGTELLNGKLLSGVTGT